MALKTLVLRTDGCSKGNPGPAAIGVVIETPEGETVEEIKQYLGETTNNVAEYMALLEGVKKARDLGAEDLRIYADSKLMVNQLIGAYRVKNPALLGLRNDVLCELEDLRWEISYVPREQNAQADRLANMAINLQG